MSDVISLEGVSLLRGGQAILEGIDWTVGEGERWIVLGPNGAGKTTLLEIASLYLFPSSGRVTVLGAVHGRTDVRPLRGRIGYASAALARLLHADMTALDAVATGQTGVLDPYWAMPGGADLARASDLLRRMGCAHLARHALGTLSEGERQRVQVARALMPSPDVLLLDEPSAGLDLGARELLVTSLSDLALDSAVRAIVFVTHHVEEIPAGFSHALLLRGGRVLAAGPLPSTLTSEALSACFGIPLAVESRKGRWTSRARMPIRREIAGGSPKRHEARARPPERDIATGLVRDPDGRLKVHRPLPAAERLAALRHGLTAYAAGDYFAAHEILEPAWMGTDVEAERALYQGLIKLAAAGVHAVRGNSEGVRRNLEGASRRLALVPEAAQGSLGEALASVDLAAIRSWMMSSLAAISAVEADPDAARAVISFVSAAPAPVRRASTGRDEEVETWDPGAQDGGAEASEAG